MYICNLNSYKTTYYTNTHSILGVIIFHVYIIIDISYIKYDAKKYPL